MTVLSRHAVLRAALIGFGLGAAWGVLARIWMRLVSTEHEFSWSGTLAIVGITALSGALVGLSWCARRAMGRRRWLRLLFLPGLLLFAGQGAPFAPAFLVAGPLLRRSGVLARGLTAVALAGPAVFLWWTDRLNEVTMLHTPYRVQVSMLVGMPLLALALAGAGHLALGRLPVGEGQSESADLARSSRLSDSSLEAPAGPA